MNILRKWKKNENTSVVDPFCGRGTTLFAARRLNLVSYGIDSSPVAVAIAQAKLCKVEIADALLLARDLINNSRPTRIPETDFFANAYHPLVLRQICSLREGLLHIGQETSASVLLRAAILGCLHGPLSKNIINQSYLSNQMPRTFSTKPDYSVKYWRDKGLIAPNLDAIDVLHRKLLRISNGEKYQNTESFHNVLLGDSTDNEIFKEELLNFSTVITSPPYYGMRTYVEDQWLRNWFLGGPDYVPYTNNFQLEHTSKVNFAESLGKVWRNMGRSKADNLHMYIRFGVIPSANVNARELMMSSLEASNVKWQPISLRSAKSAESGKRQADQMVVKSNAALELDFHLVRV